MSITNALVCLLALSALQPRPSDAARVLGIFGMKGKSHTMITEPLLQGLAQRGHYVLTYGHYPSEKNNSLANYNYVQFKKQGNYGPGLDVSVLENMYIRTLNPLKLLGNGIADCEAILDDPQIVDLINSDLEFDLLVTEVFNADCYLGFAHRFKIPVVAISTCPIMPWGNGYFGNPDNPAYIPNTYSGYTNEMPLGERLINTMQNVYLKAVKTLYFGPRDQEITERAFGSDLPLLTEIGKNISVLLTNTHHTLSLPRPFITNVVEIGGIHIKPQKELPEVGEKRTW